MKNTSMGHGDHIIGPYTKDASDAVQAAITLITPVALALCPTWALPVPRNIVFVAALFKPFAF